MPLYNDGNQPDDALHRLLLKAVPANEHGNKTINHLATLIPCRRSNVNKWIRLGRIPPGKAMRVVEIGKIGEDGETLEVGRVTLEDFHPFVYNT